MRRFCLLMAALVSVSAAIPSTAADSPAEKKKIVFIAGQGTHGFGSHDHKAGCHLLAKALNGSGMPVHEAVVIENGWPTRTNPILDGAARDRDLLPTAAAATPPCTPHSRQALRRWTKASASAASTTPSRSPPTSRPARDWLKWIGGYFETNWSVNPHWWTANFKELPKHAVTPRREALRTNDEWYYNMRFREDMEGVTPILTAIPPEETRGAANAHNPHGGNPAVRARKGMPEAHHWVSRERTRRIAAASAPPAATSTGTGARTTGASSCSTCRTGSPRSRCPRMVSSNQRPTVDEMLANHDEPVPENFNKEAMQERIEKMNRPAAK